ncbi:MAG: hypothetical protein ACJ70R_04855 [Nitrososphaera sp.]
MLIRSEEAEQIIIILLLIYPDTEMSDSIDYILQLPQRKIIVAENDVFLNEKRRNDIFILMVEESIGSAGGRAAGFGHRRVERIYGFSCYESGECTKFFDASEQSVIDRFDIPYSAVAMDIRLSDGTPYTLQGIVDPDSVATYRSVIANLK